MIDHCNYQIFPWSFSRCRCVSVRELNENKSSCFKNKWKYMKPPGHKDTKDHAKKKILHDSKIFKLALSHLFF